jgi:DNA-binding CsgD family transcriptional regulator
VYHELGDRLNTALTLNYLGIVACDRGDRAGAAARFAAGLPLWTQLGDLWPLADWLAGVATLAVRCGAPERAARLFGAAEALCVELGHAFSLPERASFERAIAAARTALGEAEFAGGLAAGRALPLEQALDEAAAFLATIAEPAPPAERPPVAEPFGLTPREREVLVLLCQRRTDREIAETLFITPRTAGFHVANVLAKLGAANRREVAALAARHGLHSLA